MSYDKNILTQGVHNNMYKFLLAGLLLIFLIPISVNALTFESTPIQTTGVNCSYNPNYNIGRLSGLYHDGYYYVACSQPRSSGANSYVYKYDIDDFSTELENTGYGSFAWGDFVVAPYNDSIFVAFVDDGASGKYIKYTKYSDMSVSGNLATLSDTTPNSCANTELSVDFDTGFIMEGTTTSTFGGMAVYYALDCTTKFGYTNNSIVTVYKPTTYGRPKDINFISSAYNYMFFEHGTSTNDGVYVNKYNPYGLTTNNYIGTYNIKSITDTSLNVSSLSVKEVSGGFFVAYLTNNTRTKNVSSIVIKLMDDTGYDFSTLYELRYTPPNVDNVTNYTGYIDLGYNDDKSQLYLFYNVFNATNNAYLSTWVVKQAVPCYCGAWSKSGYCVGDYAKYERTCLPNLCANETKYEIDSVCQYNNSLENSTITKTCTATKTSVKNNLYCEPDSFEIPPEAINVTSTVTTTINFYSTTNNSWFFNPATLGCQLFGNAFVETCNPKDNTLLIDNCVNATVKVNDLFMSNSSVYTQTRTYTGLIAGDLATGSSSASSFMPCADEWSMTSELKVTYITGLFCNGQATTICIDNTHLKYLDANCLPIKIEVCKNGCNTTDNTCIVLPTEKAKDTPIIAGLPTWISLFNIFVIGIVGLGAFIEYKIRTGGLAFLSVIILGMAVGSYYEIIPSWITIIFGLILALIGAWFIRNKIVGGG